MRFFNLSTCLQMAALFGAAVLANPAHAKPGGVGWQTPLTFVVPTGSSDVFEHAYCPKGLFAVSAGGFALNNLTLQNGFILTGQGPRLDLSPPKYNEWVWNYEWPAGGAPAGATVVLNVYCAKGIP